MHQKPFVYQKGEDLRFLIICDHASNYIPPQFDDLGLPREAFTRHIAYDVGAAETAQNLSHLLDCPLVMSQFSRLLIDPNRGLDDPTLIMKYSDGIIIPANRNPKTRQTRIDEFYTPYDNAIARAREAALQQNITPVILSIHSFTKIWNNTPRPWEAAVLWDKDPRLKTHICDYMQNQHPEICFGNNQPYSGRLKNDCLYRHATSHGIPHALIELRQDVATTKAGQNVWATRLAHIMQSAVQDDELTQMRHYGSFADT